MAETAQQPRTGTRHPAAEAPESQPGSEPGEGREGSDLIDAAARAANGKDKLNDEEQVDALEWFLSDTDATELTHTFQVNVGTQLKKVWIDWTIKPVDMDRLRAIRRRSAQGGSRRQRAQGEQFDEVAANVQIVLEGTIDPDLRAAGKQLGAADPSFAVRGRFAHKPGLLAQIAGEIMSLSGYDDEDVREVDAARG
jgi:hypothetical protein